LYKFRFGSSDLIAKRFNKPSGKYVQKRLHILEDQGYIAKHYEKSYKLQGKPAAYYLLPRAAKLLQAQHPDFITDQGIKNRYKDKLASESFIAHCLGIYTIYTKLKALYGDNLIFFSKSDLSFDKYDYFPKWLPDAYMIIKGGVKGTGQQRLFFLDIFEETTPFFVLVRRIKSYLSYAQSEQWDGDLPTILMIFETASTQKRLNKRIAKELDQLWDDELVSFYTTTKQQLMASNYQNDKIWQSVTELDVIKSLSNR
jgi:hypothetical protein